MRKYYLDNIRWGTVLLVAAYHVLMIYSGVTPLGLPFRGTQYQDAVMYLLYPWLMILLFIVAGMSARYYLERHSVREFVRARTRKLLVPSTVGVLTAGWIQGYISISLSGGFESLAASVPPPILCCILVISGSGALWFLHMLWLCSMLLAFLRRFETGKLYSLTEGIGMAGIVLLAVPVWLSGLALNTPVITVYRFGIYPLSFFLGYFLFAHDAVIERISRWKMLMIPAAAVLGVWYAWAHFGENFGEMPLMGSIPAVSFAWAAVLAILGGIRAWGDKTTPFTEFMRKKSFGIYVFHYPALTGTAYVLRKYTDLGAVPCYLLTAAAAFAGSLLLYEIVSRIPVLRWCLLGIRKERPYVS